MRPFLYFTSGLGMSSQVISSQHRDLVQLDVREKTDVQMSQAESTDDLVANTKANSFIYSFSVPAKPYSGLRGLLLINSAILIDCFHL